MVEHERIVAERTESLERLCKAETLRMKVQSGWESTTGDATQAMRRAARFADLVIAGQFDTGDPESLLSDEFAGNLVLSSGRPVLTRSMLKVMTVPVLMSH